MLFILKKVSGGQLVTIINCIVGVTGVPRNGPFGRNSDLRLYKAEVHFLPIFFF